MSDQIIALVPAFGLNPQRLKDMGDGTWAEVVYAVGGGSGSNAAAGVVNTTAPASASYTGFLSGANIVPVSATNPLPISGTISATTTANATAAAPTYTSGSNPLSVDFAGNLRVGGTFYQATQPVSAAALPLPAGAATSALQTTINTTLGTPFQAGGSVGITGTPAFKVSDTAGAGITSTLLAGKQRLDVTLAAGGAPGATASIVADQVGGVDSGGLLRALSVDTGGRVNVQGGNATAVKTDGSAVTQPVSGTVAVTGAYQATQPVSIAVMPTTPVTGTFYQATQPISGTVAVTGAYQATQPVSILAMPTTPVTGTFFQATQPVSLAALPALAVGANAIGSITNTAFGVTGTVAVTGAFYQTTQPVSGMVAVTGAYQATQPVSIATMPSTPVTGAFYQTTQPVSGSVGVSNFPATQAVSIVTMPSTPVTGAFYQATQPVSGTVAVTGAYQATQPVSIATMPTTPVTGTFYQATQPVSITALPALTTGANVIGGVTISGTLPAFAAPPTVKLSDTAGAGITSTTIAGKQRLDVTLAAGGAPGATASTIADQVGGVDGGGLLRALSVDTGGRVNVIVATSLPAGANTIGGVTIADGSAVTIGTTTDVAYAGSGSASIVAALKGVYTATLAPLAAGANLIGKVDTVLQSTAVDRGAIIGFSGAVISTTSGSNTITLTTAPTTGAVILGQQITATGVPAGSYIYALASGTLSVAGSTYTLSSSAGSLVASNATAAATGIAGTSAGPQQLMASNTSRRGTSYQVQSTTANVWTNGFGAATADYHSLKIPPGTYYESAPTQTGTGVIAAIADTAATPIYAREW